MDLENFEKSTQKQFKELNNSSEINKIPSSELIEESIEQTENIEENKDENSENDSELFEESVDELEELEEEEENNKNLTSQQKKEKNWAALREKNKNAQMEIQALKERLARIEGQEEARNQLKPESQLPEEKIPDKEWEPDEYFQWETNKKLEKMEKTIEEQNKQLQASKAEQIWKNLEFEANKKDPSYIEAKEFLINERKKEIKEAVPYASETQIEQQIKAEEYQLVASAAGVGIDPIQQIQFLAWQKGFNKKNGKEEAEITKKPQVNMEKLKKNINKSANLIGGTTKGKMEKLTAEQMVQMSLDELAKMSQSDIKEATRNMTMNNIPSN